jgi:hypothetical protein
MGPLPPSRDPQKARISASAQSTGPCSISKRRALLPSQIDGGGLAAGRSVVVHDAEPGVRRGQPLAVCRLPVADALLREGQVRSATLSACMDILVRFGNSAANSEIVPTAAQCAPRRGGRRARSRWAPSRRRPGNERATARRHRRADPSRSRRQRRPSYRWKSHPIPW